MNKFNTHLNNLLRQPYIPGEVSVPFVLNKTSLSSYTNYGYRRLLRQINSEKEFTYMSLENEPNMDECIKQLKEICKDVWSSEVPSYEFCGIVTNWSFTTKISGETIDDITNNVPLFLKGYTKDHPVFGSNVGIITPRITRIFRTNLYPIEVTTDIQDVLQNNGDLLNVYINLGSSYTVTTEDNKVYSTAMPDILLRMEIASRYTQRELKEMQPYEYVFDYFNKKLGV